MMSKHKKINKMNKLATSNGEIVEGFRTVKTIQEALMLPTPAGSIVLLEKYPVHFRAKNWRTSECTKVRPYVSNLCNNQGVLLLISEHKITAYAKFNKQLHSLSDQLSWSGFLETHIRF